jgi:hypothetical protein
LRPWQDQLPESSSPIERAETVINFFSKRFNVKGENALVLFMYVLHKRLHPEDQCQVQLGEFIGELEDSLQNQTRLESEVKAIKCPQMSRQNIGQS